MEVFRLARLPYSDSLSGVGAAIKGARWNSPGVEMVYTASNRSLAMAEVAVHLSVSALPDDYFMLTIFVPDDIRATAIYSDELPEGWNVFPHLQNTQIIGDTFIRENRFGLCKVPSAVTKGDFNFLINPHHPDFNRIKIIHKEPFPYDRRLFI